MWYLGHMLETLLVWNSDVTGYPVFSFAKSGNLVGQEGWGEGSKSELKESRQKHFWNYLAVNLLKREGDEIN